MVRCYTLTENNTIMEGISIRTDIINNIRYVAPRGRNTEGRLEIQRDFNKHRIEYGELFDNTYMEYNNTSKEGNKEIEEDLLISVEWASEIFGGSIESNILDCVWEGSIEIISHSTKIEGLTTDFLKRIITDRFLIVVKKPCTIEYESLVKMNGGRGYTSKVKREVELVPGKVPKVSEIRSTSSYTKCGIQTIS